MVDRPRVPAVRCWRRGSRSRSSTPSLLTRPLWLLNRRDHRKILIVDRRNCRSPAGVNISDDNLPEAQDDAWRDTQVEIEGAAAAARLATLFEAGWRRAHHFPPDGGRPRRSARERGSPPGAGLQDRGASPCPSIPKGVRRRSHRPAAYWSACSATATVRTRFRIRRAYLEAIDRAAALRADRERLLHPVAHSSCARWRGRCGRGGRGARAAWPARATCRRRAGRRGALYQRLLDDGVRLSEWTARDDALQDRDDRRRLVDRRELQPRPALALAQPRGRWSRSSTREFAAALTRRMIDGLAGERARRSGRRIARRGLRGAGPGTARVRLPVLALSRAARAEAPSAAVAPGPRPRPARPAARAGSRDRAGP